MMPLHYVLVQFRRITDMIAARGRVRRRRKLMSPCFPTSSTFPRKWKGGRGSISGASIIVSVYAAITCPEERRERAP